MTHQLATHERDVCSESQQRCVRVPVCDCNGATLHLPNLIPSPPGVWRYLIATPHFITPVIISEITEQQQNTKCLFTAEGRERDTDRQNGQTETTQSQVVFFLYLETNGFSCCCHPEAKHEA